MVSDGQVNNGWIANYFSPALWWVGWGVTNSSVSILGQQLVSACWLNPQIAVYGHFDQLWSAFIPGLKRLNLFSLGLTAEGDFSPK